MRKNKLQSGYAIIYLLVIIFISSLILFPVINLVANKMMVINTLVAKEQAIQVAEAGLNYYQKYLPINNLNNQNFTDLSTNQVAGQFNLEINPGDTGQVVKIKSTGWISEKPEVKKTITAYYGKPSITKYTVLTSGNSILSDTESLNFSGFENIYNQIKLNTTSQGYYLNSSNAGGYLLDFNNNNISIYKVLNLQDNSVAIGKDTSENNRNEKTDYDETQLLETIDTPETGLIFSEDPIWVEGEFSGRLTITAPQIYIANNLTYLNKDDENILGLMALEDIIITNHSSDDLEINAALLAINGAVQRFYYTDDLKNSLTFYGSIISNKPWTFDWKNSSAETISGYQNIEIVHDNNLPLNPPPMFPNLNEKDRLFNYKLD